MLHRNWTIANEPPQTEHRRPRAAQPAHPLIVTTSHAGTISETIGSWRPAIALSSCASMPVTTPSVRIGVPIAPYATGAVLAMSDRPAA